MKVTPATTVGWCPTQLIKDILSLKVECLKRNQNGPYLLVLGYSWDRYLTVHYDSFSSKLLGERIKEIDGIVGIYLPIIKESWTISLWSQVAESDD
jgi:hypothetical protein